MATKNRAHIKPELLQWGRQMSGMPRYVAAKKIGVSDKRLESWESGDEKPTINQLRKVANTYKQSFAAFFLPEAPTVPKLPLKDYRRLPGATSHELSHEIVMDVRHAMDRRVITLDLAKLNELEVKPFKFEGNMSETGQALAERIRADLGVELDVQLKLRTTNKGLHYWRQTLENIGVLVFQSLSIDIGDMRGYSIFEDVFPIIVVNRKDAEAARIFTMIHELVHLYLRASGLCNLEARTDIPPEEQQLEQFCNDVAANVLVPIEHFTSHEILRNNNSNRWTEEEVSKLARDYCVSREMIARRLFEVSRADETFYLEKRNQYTKEYKDTKAKKKDGFVPPSTDVISKCGKVFSELIIRSLSSRRINSSQASELLGVKLRHISKIRKSVGY